MKIKPLNDWAVIVPSEAEEKTSGGLYIPDTAKEKPQIGMVEAIGPGAYEEKKYGKKKADEKERKFIHTTVKPGDRVLYEKYAGQTYKIGSEDRTLVRERDILGVLPPRPATPKAELPPLQIPVVTSTAQETAIAKRPSQTAVTAVAPKPEKPAKKQGPGAGGQGPGKAKKQGPGSRGQGPGKTKKKK